MLGPQSVIRVLVTFFIPDKEGVISDLYAGPKRFLKTPPPMILFKIPNILINKIHKHWPVSSLLTLLKTLS